MRITIPEVRWLKFVCLPEFEFGLIGSTDCTLRIRYLVLWLKTRNDKTKIISHQ
jgi:lipid-A-disaccharide synthase-like uncharacterized protein